MFETCGEEKTINEVFTDGSCTLQEEPWWYHVSMLERCDDMKTVKIKKLNPDAIIPSRGSVYAAGYDLYAC